MMQSYHNHRMQENTRNGYQGELGNSRHNNKADDGYR